MKSKKIRVLSVDDHAILAEGLEALLAMESDLEFVGHLPGAEDLVGHVERLEADIVLMDISMPGVDPFAAIRELHARCPEVRSIILSAFVRDQYIDAAYAAGAWGYLAKSDSPEAVIRGIRRVVEGELAFTPEVACRTKSGDSPRPPASMQSKLGRLTPREREVLLLIAQGLSRTEIAEQISRSPMTIDNHRKSIMKKLGLRDRVELVRYAIAEGLVAV